MCGLGGDDSSELGSINPQFQRSSCKAQMMSKIFPKLRLVMGPGIMVQITIRPGPYITFPHLGNGTLAQLLHVRALFLTWQAAVEMEVPEAVLVSSQQSFVGTKSLGQLTVELMVVCLGLQNIQLPEAREIYQTEAM